MEKKMGQSRKSATYIWKHLFVWAMLIVLTLSVKLPVSAAGSVTDNDLASPVVDKESHVKGGQHISTYNYVYFGSYPQKEITREELTDAIKNASYDSYGNGTVNGKRYRRLTYDMLSEAGTINDRGDSSRKLWAQLADNGYRYFLYEPIKWRILKKENGELMLFSEYGLDTQMAGVQDWENCDIRKWLNYDGGTEPKFFLTGFHSPGFLYYAFDQQEQKIIKLTHLKQEANPVYGTSGGADTEDKIYLLSYADICNNDYGFCGNGEDIFCIATITQETAFALAAQGTNGALAKLEGKKPEDVDTIYWLRDIGKRDVDFQCVSALGRVNLRGRTGNDTECAVRPALNVNYSLSNCIRISFVTNTDVKIEDQILLDSNYAKEPETLTRNGYKFTGWYLDSACTKQYLFNQKLTKDTTLYAGWITPEEQKRLEEQKKRREEIQEQFQVSEETAAKIDQFLQENQIPADTLAVTDETILATSNDNDIKGSTFGILQARAIKTTSKTIKLRWSKVANADGYLIYGNKCGKKNKYEPIKTIQNNRTTTFTQKSRKKGTYYKYIVRAYKEFDGTKITVAVSKTVHAATTGGKFGNAKSVKVNKTKVTLNLNKKKKSKYTLKTKEVKQSKKISKHRAIAYESSNPDVATVSKKGAIQAKKKGSCTIYAYAQNGVYKKIKVQVK